MASNILKHSTSAHISENIDLQLEVLKTVPRFFNDEDNLEIDKPVLISELQEIVNKMPKEKSYGPDGWTQELFHNFFDIMGEDLLNAVEESRIQYLSLGPSMQLSLPSFLRSASRKILMTLGPLHYAISPTKLSLKSSLLGSRIN
jgi:hypothetical protein